MSGVTLLSSQVVKDALRTNRTISLKEAKKINSAYEVSGTLGIGTSNTSSAILGDVKLLLDGRDPGVKIGSAARKILAHLKDEFIAE